LAGNGVATRAVYVRHPSSLEHDTGGHPERAERIVAIEEQLAARDWLGYERIEAPPVELETLYAVHPPAYVGSIAGISERGGGMLDLDTVASARSFDAALHAAGGAVHACELLLRGDAGVAFCGLRPPGHHAERSRAMGFCLFNNIAVAAAHALARGIARRILVLDWDVHHGNGTNDIFYASNAVLYVSIHQSPLYPGTGHLNENGAGEGEGYSVNLPVRPGSGHAEWLSLAQHVVAPIARSYEPDLLLVSAGYDAHRDDPLASCTLSDDSYAALASVVRGLATELGAPIGIVLEGGYDLGALARSVAATLAAALDGDGTDAVAVAPVAAEAASHYARWWPALD
jgi:acetoin utilization deacetylase AcuC-like enzyme